MCRPKLVGLYDKFNLGLQQARNQTFSRGGFVFWEGSVEGYSSPADYRGSGGSSYKAPPAGSGAEPQPLASFTRFRSEFTGCGEGSRATEMLTLCFLFL